MKCNDAINDILSLGEQHCIYGNKSLAIGLLIGILLLYLKELAISFMLIWFIKLLVSLFGTMQYHTNVLTYSIDRVQYCNHTDSEKGSPLAAQQQGGGWQSGSQWGTAATGSQQLQSQVPQGTDVFSNKAPFTSYTGTQLLNQQPQQNYGSIEHLQQQFGSMSISGVQYPQNFQSSQQQYTESQWPQPFTGVQQPRQQLKTFTDAKYHQQQFQQFISPQQQHQSFSMPQYSQQQQPFTWAQLSQPQLQQLHQPQQITGAQPPFNTEMQYHLQSFATAQPPQQQHFFQMPHVQPLQQSFRTMHSPQRQFNVAQQPQQMLFSGNQQQLGSAQQPQQQWRTYTGSHHQQQPIQQPLQPHQQRPVNINPFTVS